ncbi:YqaJ viral recombinase [Dillenia turbinata]|uniref:YqaJ viral recombinase n=1 Tax=Dillenia turbinata TaxID=194707 RepID=A0AAN8Z2M7_9MAGN
MTNACIIKFLSINHKAAASLSPGKNLRPKKLRALSTCASLVISSGNPSAIHSPSELVLAARLSASDIPQRSDEWFALRKDKLTTSTFSTALGFWKRNRRFQLWHEKVYTTDALTLESAARHAMEWGVLNESAAIERYKSITGREVSSYGFAIHSDEQFDWLGASPDGLLGCFPDGGILEVKCPYNKGKPEIGLPWSTMPFYYMPQVQGQMEIMNRDWVDLYCWTPNGSTIFRVHREREYWLLIHGILQEFWWKNVIPAREALLLGKEEEEIKLYAPKSTHNQTGLTIMKSMKLAADAKLLCRDIAGHVEFYSNVGPQCYGVHNGEVALQEVSCLIICPTTIQLMQEKGEKRMDSGLSWADIWDSSNDPLPSSSENDKKKKGKDGKSEKKKWNLKWVKDLCKKSNK